MSRFIGKRRNALLGFVALGALAASAPTPAVFAARHIGLASSSPAKDSHLMKAPTEIRLTFTGRIDVTKASVELLTADSKPVALDSLRAVPDSVRVAVARIVAPLPGGTYTVRWKAIAADGAAGSGSFGFMYMAPAGKD
jgi:methionine-rich copper-binding protein CopC